MMEKLAIIIPAYKPDFLKSAISSVAAQTCRDFTVYVCDDASPFDIQSIINEFKSELDIHYTRFEENLGATDLVAQWNRCIGQTQGEEWLWLFSDDDVMEPECVGKFLATDKSGHDVIHFDIDIIDSEGNTIRRCNPYPKVMSSADFYRLLYSHKIDARMPEFIFRADTLKRNGFVPFDLAWRSDNASVMLNSLGNGILTISGENSKVLWRASDSNISNVENNRERKNKSTIDFFNWVYDFFRKNGIPFPISTVYQLKTILFEFVYKDSTSFRKESIAAGRQLKFVKPWLWPVYYALILYRIYYRRHDLKQA